MSTVVQVVGLVVIVVFSWTVLVSFVLLRVLVRKFALFLCISLGTLFTPALTMGPFVVSVLRIVHGVPLSYLDGVVVRAV